MADSDDDFGRRKFRDRFGKDFSERRYDYGERRGFGSGNRDYKPAGGGGGGGGGFRQRNEYSPPSNKRVKRDWEEATFDSPKKEEKNDSGCLATPMMTFKQFLATQDDMISDDDAMQKYKDYKLDHHKQQLHAFFLLHKDEEWFKLKYHPEESTRRRNEHLAGIKRRLNVFMELNDKGWVTRCALDQDSAENLIKLMDAVVVKLEGGTEDDLEAIENSYTFEEVDETSAIEPKKEEEENDEIKEDAAPREDEKEILNVKEDEEDQANGKANESEGEISAHESDKEDYKKPPTPIKKNVSAEKITLHRTSSIFLRNLAPAITRQEVEALFKRYPGYLRVALAEPLQERRFYRRGWVSFRRDVNVKEICWNLSTIRLKDCDLGAIVNRDLTRRIRTVNGVTGHKTVMQSDLRNVVRLVQLCDSRMSLWLDDDTLEGNDSSNVGFEGMHRNPLMVNVTDHLVEEASAEEEELLGTSSEEVSANGALKVPFVRDMALTKVIDPLLLYLRIVHSVDFYNHGEYPNEDEMPNRCGLIHVRGAPPLGQGESNQPFVSVQFVNEFIKTFECKLQPLLAGKETLSEDELAKLGKKDPDKEVETFISANCQELAKDKWLCPLSGKKFKGPEFVKKHIFNKHPEKLQDVRTEAEYFNNYLADAKRPFMLETSRQQHSASTGGDRPPASERHHTSDFGRQGGGGDRGYGERSFGSGGGNYSGGGGGYRQGGNYGRRDYQRRDYGGGGGGGAGGGQRSHGNRFSNNDSRKDSRIPMAYTDLDAPDEIY